MRSGIALTPRELEVASLVAEGLTNKEIAARLFLSERTAEGHVEHIRDKLGFSARSQIASWYTRAQGALAPTIPAAPVTASAVLTRAPAPVAAPSVLPRRLVLVGAPILVAIFVAAIAVLARPTNPTLVLFAGLGTDGNSGDGGPALVAQFSELNSMFFDAEGRLVIADSQGGLSHGQFIDHSHIRRIALDGTITSVSGDGTLDYRTSASAVALAMSAGGRAAKGPGNTIFVSFGYEYQGGGSLSGTLGRIDPDGAFHLLMAGVIPGAATGAGSASLGRLIEPTGLVVDHDGTVFFLDNGNSVVRALAPDGSVRIVAGTGERGNTGDDGPATQATLFAPLGLALSADSSLFIADTNNNRVRRIDHGGAIHPVLDGLALPSSLAFGPGGVLYVADTGNSRVLRVTSDGAFTTVAGPSGLLRPTALAVDASGTLYIGDSGLHRIFMLAKD